MKQKTKKALEKRIKITGSGKVTRRHQFSGGHLKRKKSNGALNAAKKTKVFASGEIKTVRRLLGIQKGIDGSQFTVIGSQQYSEP